MKKETLTKNKIKKTVLPKKFPLLMMEIKTKKKTTKYNLLVKIKMITNLNNNYKIQYHNTQEQQVKKRHENK